MDITQIVIIVSLISISTAIVFCSVYLIMIFREFKITITKTNAILDDTKLVSSSISQPLTSISEFITGFKNGIGLFNSLFDKKSKKLKITDK